MPTSGKKQDMKSSDDAERRCSDAVWCAQRAMPSMKARIAAKTTTQAMELRIEGDEVFPDDGHFDRTGLAEPERRGRAAEHDERARALAACAAAAARLVFCDAPIDASSNETLSAAAMKKKATPSARTTGTEIASIADRGRNRRGCEELRDEENRPDERLVKGRAQRVHDLRTRSFSAAKLIALEVRTVASQ